MSGREIPSDEISSIGSEASSYLTQRERQNNFPPHYGNPSRSVQRTGKHPCSITFAGGRRCCPWRFFERYSVFVVDPDVPGLVYQRDTDHDRQQGNHDRIPQTVIDVSRPCHDRRGEQRKHAAEPAIADMVRQRH